ncbi:MAG: type II toxin-antitoxin system Phd/YefM family antitoxin [Solirubrobacterales bacterium]|jgi:antitoxin (DNA-binding transcriptional repressor) of toxin-antitoxin stability system
MRIMAISKFKTNCLAAVEEVRTSGESILLTKRGEAVAEVVPASRDSAGKRQLGTLAGTIELPDDLISPVDKPEEWEALRD